MAYSWACFEASGLNNILYSYANCDILDNSSLRDSDEEREPARKSKYYQQKSWAFKFTPLYKLLI